MRFRTKLPWIAVALATAIRLWADPAATYFAPVVLAVITLSVVALVLARDTCARVAPLFLLLVSAVDLSTLWYVRDLARTFEARSASHIGEDMLRVRYDVATIEAQLDAAADRVESRLAMESGEPDRSALFSLLRREIVTPERGGRIVRAGETLAWWGQELRTAGARTYEFDATGLYIIRTRAANGFAIEVFERIPNEPKASSRLHPHDDWIVSSFFHAGYLEKEPEARRYVVAKRPDATLFVDFKPRPKSELLDAARGDGIDASALLLGLGALGVLALLLRRDDRGRPTAWIVLIVIARWALLPLRVDDDPLRIFQFDVFASRILGPFSRSPFDLLLTAAAILGIAVALNRMAVRVPLLVRTVAALIAAYDFVLLARNLVNNSRISSIPQHIAPSSAAQSVLLAALLMFGFALLQLTRHSESHRRTWLAIAIVALPFVLLSYSIGRTSGAALLYTGAAV
ncbi:MAG TPA: hypothetical protein VN605_07505, partial [Thermoanaerobaculia bacterium]|nr:hypothetical protein [Thermoanaerobaculia bacterium]